MKTSLIITTYNWSAALELVLLSLLKQSRLPDEIIIADDGSTEATKQLIGRYTDKFQCGLHHIWQADKGFQKTKILNKAVAKANGDYIIQIDGDILLHKHFIKIIFILQNKALLFMAVEYS
jgi:glycosyltransferase involved in cell wall biosynthesis